MLRKLYKCIITICIHLCKCYYVQKVNLWTPLNEFNQVHNFVVCFPNIYMMIQSEEAQN
jgi:hypothetical protein